MIYKVIYRNPNNIIRTGDIVFQTESRFEFNNFMKNANKYPGSYNIIDIEKIRTPRKSTKEYTDGNKFNDTFFVTEKDKEVINKLIAEGNQDAIRLSKKIKFDDEYQHDIIDVRTLTGPNKKIMRLLPSTEFNWKF
jgi:hypothetical protein